MSPANAAPKIGSSDESIQTILVVEDEVLIRLPLAEYLRDCGYRVFEASNVAEAKAVLDADTPVDLVFSDVRMPGQMDGIGLAKWVRENRSDLPVFLASGDIGKTNIARELCAEEPFFAKPYDLDAVANRIRHALVGRSGAGT